MSSISEVCTVTFSAVTVGLSYLTFVRNRTLENQNILYRYKQEKYHTILKTITDLYTDLDKVVDKYYDELETKNNEEVLDTLSDEAFNLLGDFYKKIYADTALLPKTVMDAVVAFVEKVQDLDILPIEEPPAYEKTLELLTVIDPFVDKIELAMRKDLRLQEIDAAFHKRIANTIVRRS